MSWLLKVRRYGGGESVIGRFDEKQLADHGAASWNDQYQTDAAYVERWELAKSDWPSIDFEFLRG